MYDDSRGEATDMTPFQQASYVPTDAFGPESGAPHWPLVLDLMIKELVNAAGEQESGHFLAMVGRRLAEENPVGSQPTVSTLQAAINRCLARLQWGWCVIRDEGKFLSLEHGDYPAIESDQGEAGETRRRWGVAMLLTGLYQQWFETLGGDAAISCQRCLPGQSLLFHYGRS